MTPQQIMDLIQKESETLFRSPDGWASMERHDQPGSPRNLVFTPVQPVTKMTNEQLIQAMRDSYTVNVKRIISRITGVDLD